MTKAPSKSTARTPKVEAGRKPATGTKQDKILNMLHSTAGATVEAIVKATGWQPHSVRGFLSIVPKWLGLRIESDKAPGKNRVYRVVAGKPLRRSAGVKGRK
jgi:hypothetical protein